MAMVEITVGESRHASHWLTARKVDAFRPNYRDKVKHRLGDGALSIMVLFNRGDYESREYAIWIAREYRRENFTSLCCHWYAEDWQEATVNAIRRTVNLNV